MWGRWAMSREFARTATDVRLPDWARLLRTNCVVVANNPPGLIGAANVSQRFDGISDGDREALRNIARDLAGEYGLVAEIEDNGRSISVRLSRPDLNRAEPEADRKAAAAQGNVRLGSSAAAFRAVWQTLASARRS
jgi:hypothetical protein